MSASLSPAGEPRERYRGDRLDLLKKVPGYARSILVAGSDTGLVAGILKKALGARVTVVETNATHLPVVSQIANQAFSLDDALEGSLVAAPAMDAAILLDPAPFQSHWDTFIERLTSALAPERGIVLLLCDNPGYWRSRISAAKLPDPKELTDRAAACGLGLFQQWTDENPEVMAHPQDETGNLWIEEQRFPLEGADARARLATRRFLFKLVPASYDPFKLSQHLHAEGRHDDAYNELSDLPLVYKERDGVGVVLHSQMLFYLSEYAAAHGPEVARAILFRAQEHLYQVIAKEPDFPPPQEYYAAIAALAGADAQADRVRRSFHRAYPRAEGVAHPGPRREFSRIDIWSERMNSAFAWPGKPPRLLYLIHPSPHYGLDLVYDGLCEALGDEQVVEWPWKPTLHGVTPDTHAHYPCHFNRQGAVRSYEAVRDGLENGDFDVLLLGDADCDLPADAVRELVAIARGRSIPVLLLDAMDEYIDMRPHVYEKFGIDHFDIYFKREMAEFMEYGGNTWPMPFAYARSKIIPHEALREPGLFWAGHRNFGFRRMYLEYLERTRGLDLSVKFDPDEYTRRIASAQIGLSLFGKGFDTVRYWELPAHGALLFSDRVPMHIPHDFTDGENALFFNDLEEMDEKLDRLLGDPAEVERIARAGEAHFLRHHTSEARARQVLHAIHTVCFGGT